jgi:hypothetical protein
VLVVGVVLVFFGEPLTLVLLATLWNHKRFHIFNYYFFKWFSDEEFL